jgi:hypothetical protein
MQTRTKRRPLFSKRQRRAKMADDVLFVVLGVTGHVDNSTRRGASCAMLPSIAASIFAAREVGYPGLSGLIEANELSPQQIVALMAPHQLLAGGIEEHGRHRPRRFNRPLPSLPRGLVAGTRASAGA